MSAHEIYLIGAYVYVPVVCQLHITSVYVPRICIVIKLSWTAQTDTFHSLGAKEVLVVDQEVLDIVGVIDSAVQCSYVFILVFVDPNDKGLQSTVLFFS